MLKFDLGMWSASTAVFFFQALFGAACYWHTRDVKSAVVVAMLIALALFTASFSHFMSGANNTVEMFDTFSVLVASVAVLALLQSEILAGCLLTAMATLAVFTCSRRIQSKNKQPRSFLLMNTVANLPLGVGTIIGTLKIYN